MYFTLLHLSVAAYRDVFGKRSNHCSEAFFAKIFNGFKLLIIAKAASQMIYWFENRLLMSGFEKY